MKNDFRMVTKVERTVVEEVVQHFPLWMQYAMDGQKIHAIKELRELAGEYSHTGEQPHKIGLKQAKDIVESIMDLRNVYPL